MPASPRPRWTQLSRTHCSGRRGRASCRVPLPSSWLPSSAGGRLGIRLVKCQLGLFGYSPEKKIVQAAPAAEPAMETAIREKLENGRLTCRRAWEIAMAFQLPKMAVSAACEALQIKIKPCQLGAF
jgi:hypothetical protein